MTNLEVGDIVLCTVEKIVGTIVFVKIDSTGEQASIIISEIAPGRIRNLRDYVVPKKKIICKILRISEDRINLSLRRVTPKEQKEIKEQYKQEKSSYSVLKSILGESAEKIINQIKTENSVYEFLQESKENPDELQKLVGKENSKKILDILKNQKQKKAIIKKEVSLTTIQPNGLKLIKDILGNMKEAKIKYISAGLYSFNVEAEDMKAADNKLKEILKDIEQKAKKQSIEFALKEK